ncbi:MAG: histidine phosphatase family protein [Clostridia bacterium]|nr:histidine phosphatase family protein [Clostridia bacterium]
MRHGETDWNVKHLYQGGTDIPLNENGVSLAVETGHRMAQTRFDLLITSSLDRAKETGVLIMRENTVSHLENDAARWPSGTAEERNGVRFFSDPRLKEIGFGKWEGLCFKGEGYNLPPHRFVAFWDSMEDIDPPEGAELKCAFYARVRSFFDELAARYGETDLNILIVAHGGVARAVKYLFSGDEAFAKTATANCGALPLKYTAESGWRIENPTT